VIHGLQLSSFLLDPCQSAVFTDWAPRGQIIRKDLTFIGSKVMAIQEQLKWWRSDHLPIPPHQKVIHLLLFICIIKEIENAAVKPFGIGYRVCPRKNGG
jgi:hypothetical protein